MKKLIALTAAVAALAAPALAASITVEFSGGEAVLTVTLNDDGTFTDSNGASGTYTWDAETGELCGTTDEGTVCATIEGASDEPAVGDTASYTTADGAAGTVTITAMAE